MFKKVLIANRGEIAVRIERTCREMGISTVALWEAPERMSLHVRRADECVLLDSPRGFMDGAAILRIARETGADAIHPGYGFLAEHREFSRACETAGLTFIGPPADVVEAMGSKLDVLEQARRAGIPTVQSSSFSADADDLGALRAAADGLGYPIVIKSCQGGRGRGERLIHTSDRLDEALRQAQAEGQAVFGDRSVYLEKAIVPARVVGVQVLADKGGNLIYLGERQGLLYHGNQKVIDESPASCLTPDQRRKLWQTALDVARLFHYQNAGTVEFVVDQAGQFYFSELKTRIQVEHPLTEMVSRVDIVREQIRIAAGEALVLKQEDVSLRGWSIMCRLNAEDPFNRFLPSPGELWQVIFPGGAGVRVDTYVYSGCNVPCEYDPLVAKLTVWAEDRDQCLQRMQSALKECSLLGTATNLPLLRRILHAAEFTPDMYSTVLMQQPLEVTSSTQVLLRDLAAAVAVLYVRRSQLSHPSVPDRVQTGWHRESRHLS